ncbi:cadmium resistance transporter, putative [Cordyceps militaris CM01]|uniref:Cadmium resistance transporter, putative n=1 Tax=Cordyceps militaris (strain CM01) TaxID=983644 RepID=G3J4C9_CORMM|nr:cadmium resistance transporter, putative [Cordyceps militaris CM01]EGX96646.1 cadmium resistance transporter, putative [Cordyceps militaris CM01]
MHLGEAIGTACGAFAATNIDDIFVLVTFFAESATNRAMSPLNITIGQYAGFTAITVISMIGFGISLALPSEPIGFLGFLPMLLGFWALFDVVLSRAAADDSEHADEQYHMTNATRLKIIAKVALITLINGGDNIGTYIPLFSQTRGAEIAVYVVVFYIGVGVWCLAAWIIMKQRQVLMVAQKYAEYFIPFLYMGLGVFVIVKSHCYPWSIDHINRKLPAHPGRLVLALCTTGFLILAMSIMFAMKWRTRQKEIAEESAAGVGGAVTELAEVGPQPLTERTQTVDDASQTPEKPTTADTSLASTIRTEDDKRQIPP